MHRTKADLLELIKDSEDRIQDLKARLEKLEEKDCPSNEIIEGLLAEYENIAETYFGGNKVYNIKVRISGSFRFDFNDIKNWAITSGDIEMHEFDTPDASLEEAVEHAVIGEKTEYAKAVNKWLAKVKKVAKQYNMIDKEILEMIF